LLLYVFIAKYLLYLLILRCSMLILFSECVSCSNLFLPSSVGYILHNFNILYLKIFLVSMSVLILKILCIRYIVSFHSFSAFIFWVNFHWFRVSFCRLIFSISLSVFLSKIRTIRLPLKKQVLRKS
jgi:hypothetical protein